MPRFMFFLFLWGYLCLPIFAHAEFDQDSTQIVCPVCNGHGKLACHECKQTGKMKKSREGKEDDFSCLICDGDGAVVCWACMGQNMLVKRYIHAPEGYVKAVCNYCNGVGKVGCSTCKGLGMQLEKTKNGMKAIACKTCFGDNASLCASCKGKGVRFYKTILQTCLTCNGNGRLSCSTCEGKGNVKLKNDRKTTKCPKCEGKGKVRVAKEKTSQPKAEQKEEDFRPCAHCLGAGKIVEITVQPVPCSVCNGAGIKGCSSCEGTGKRVYKEFYD